MQNVVYLYNEILLIYKKEWGTAIRYNIENTLHKRCQTQKSHIKWFHAYETFRICKYLDRKQTINFQGLGRGEGKYSMTE